MYFQFPKYTKQKKQTASMTTMLFPLEMGYPYKTLQIKVYKLLVFGTNNQESIYPKIKT